MSCGRNGLRKPATAGKEGPLELGGEKEGKKTFLGEGDRERCGRAPRELPHL